MNWKLFRRLIPHSHGKDTKGKEDPQKYMMHHGFGGFEIKIMENKLLEKGQGVLMLHPEDLKSLKTEINKKRHEKETSVE